MELLYITLTLFVSSLLVEGFPNVGTRSDDHLEVTNITQKENHIGGGENAKEGQFPWYVGIYNPDGLYGEQFLCGGSIINKNWVLTAAHCILGDRWTLKFGSVNNKYETKQVSHIAISHENYNAENWENDIALIKIPKSLKFSKNIQSINLPNNTIGDLDGETVQISGFGDTSAGKGHFPTRLQFSNFIVSSEKCYLKYNEIENSNSILCTISSSDAVFICSGDSGGPVVYKDFSNKFVLVGVVSQVYENWALKITCIPPFIQTRVSYYLDWIERKTGIAK